MLIEFSIGNYRSFKDKVTFSMKAANIVAQDTKTDEHNTFVVDDQLTLLKGKYGGIPFIGNLSQICNL
jgi:hypothetical protein